MRSVLIILLNAIWYCQSVGSSNQEGGPVRNTLYGKIRGKITSRFLGKDVEEYLGVPYAKPPVGSLRFKRPRSPQKWPGVLNATTLPPACLQIPPDYVQIHRQNFSHFDEDCLYMNLYVPKVKEKNLPVLLFVHGGSNLVGMGAMFDGDILATQGEIIVVTFNYRLGVLGFYADKPEGINGKYGLLDQVQAMRWVNENIHFFNGDPNQVTVYGHSLGAADVGLHTVSNLTKGLFRYAIIHSGSPIAYWFISDCVPTSRKTTYPSDCKMGTNRLPESRPTYKDLMKASTNDEDFISMRGMDRTFGSFPVTVDGNYIKESPEALFVCENKIHVKSVLLVTAKDEIFPVYPEDEYNLTDYYKSLQEMFPKDVMEVYKVGEIKNITFVNIVPRMAADMIFFTPMVKLANEISKWIDDIYLLSFDYVSEELSESTRKDVAHGWDLFYIFGVPIIGHHIHNYTERDRDVSVAAMKIISNYVKHGYLSINETDLATRYNASLRNYYKLDYDEGHVTMTADVDFKKDVFEYWNKHLYKYNDLTCGNSKNVKTDIYIILLVTIIACIL